MVSYSRLRPTMSRAEPRRCCRDAPDVGAGVAAGAVGAALPRGGSVPVVLMLSPFGRSGPCRHGQGGTARRACVYHDFRPPDLLFSPYFPLPLKRFMAVVSPSATIASTASAARAMTSGSAAA